MGVHQKSSSLLRRGSELADTFIQLQVLQGQHPLASGQEFAPFAEKLAAHQLLPLTTQRITTLQINLGKRCNQSCAHCHVDASPDRKEAMTRAHVERCLWLAEQGDVQTVDITGGAPEMHPDFRYLVSTAAKMGKKVIDRCNLTILTANKQYTDLPAFFAENGVNVVSSLPHYSALRTDAQRGYGVFEASIEGLKMLNSVGYGKEGSGLELDLVYNPSGAFLPASQQTLEKEFRTQLQRRYGIAFNRLFTITNMPISRYLEYLLQSGNYERYMRLLVESFNPAAAANVMCRTMLSVSYDGYLYDCDFNQMLDMRIEGSAPHIDAIDGEGLQRLRHIRLGQHCYGCTAGAGSSCGGAGAA